MGQRLGQILAKMFVMFCQLSIFFLFFNFGGDILDTCGEMFVESFDELFDV